VKKLHLIIASITLSLSSMTVNAASTFDVEAFNRASELGNSAAQSKDYDEAFKHLDEASKLGNKVSQFTLALLYMDCCGQVYPNTFLANSSAFAGDMPSLN
jgi:hypothetical protein